MKKSHLFLIATVLFVAAGFIVVKYKKDERVKGEHFYPLKNRRGVMAQTNEAEQVQKQFADLMKIVGTNPDDTKSRMALASLYIQEARITGDYNYYNAAAMKYTNEVLEKDPLHFEALTFKSLLYVSRHHFAEGLTLAEKAKQLNPDNAFVYGMLVDGYVEMGNYDAAIDAADKMISIRPDIRSYSRVSYLREIYGDYPGAIEAMKLAVDAGLPGDEATEWARVHLGHLCETVGDLKNAEMHYLLALQNRPGYAYAIAGQGRLALTDKKYEEAVAYFLQADSLVSDHSFSEELAEAYRLSEKKDKADSLLQSLIDDMNKAVNAKHDQTINPYIDGELAHIYLGKGNNEKALEHALAEYNRRPANIEVNETVARVYYMKKEYSKALPYLETAMRTNSKEPDLLCLAGLIYAKTNDKAKAKSLFGEIIKSNIHIDESLKTDADITFNTLRDF